MNNDTKPTKSFICAVCGFRHLNAPQRISTGGASHEICPSCGFESGYTDDVQGHSYEQWRSDWVSKGLAWQSKGTPKPEDWNPMGDLHSLLKRKRPIIPPRFLAAAAAKQQSKTPPPAPPPGKQKIHKTKGTDQ